ncbi:hypothetical protein ABUE34_06860 [Kozakia baliensis]|uniref:hypothetical protein n=1 Tax=Kozakia baliensis TaxID=153496 RepID=UPI00345BF886
MQNFSRRMALRGTLGAALTALCPSCSWTDDGHGDVTMTLNVSDLDRYSSALLSGVTALATSSSLSNLLSTAQRQAFSDALATLQRTEHAITTALGDRVSLVIGRNWVQDIASDIDVIQAVLKPLSLPPSVQIILQAIDTLLPIIEALVGPAARPSSLNAEGKMTESEALAILRGKG